MQSIQDIRTKLLNKTVSVQEVTEHYLSRIASYNESYRAFITVDHDGALAQAKTLDNQWDDIKDMPLAGVPIAHKDIFCTKGLPTTCGSKMLEHFVAPYQATVAEKCQNAHTVMLGKTNMDEFAMGSSSENSYFGVSPNPWNPQKVPGGSSSGSAVAVAADFVPATTGTDTGGSIRQPAAFCGISGLKPTYGRVSRYGMIAYASSLDQGGPMARSAYDLALLYDAMAGFDAKDSTSSNRPFTASAPTLDGRPEGIKIGIPKAFFKGLPANIHQQTMDFAKSLESLGATLVDIELPHLHLSVPCYYVIAPAECSSNLSRFDGVRYGYRAASPKDLTDLYLRSRQEGFGLEVKRRIMMGTFTLSTGYYDAYFLKAQKIRTLIKQDFDEAFNAVDLILGPTTPSEAFNIGEKCDDPVAMYLNDIYTVPINLAGLPAISIPIGFEAEMPLGGQLIGRYFEEEKLLQWAHAYQLQTDWHTKRPTLEPQTT